jgi:O-antigen ligase
VSIAQRLGFPDNLPIALRLSIFCYLAHVFTQGKIALAESFAGLCIVFTFWCVGKGYIRPGFHILYYPLALYGIASTLSSILSDRSIHAYFDGITWVKIMTFPIGLMFFRTYPRMRALALWLHIAMGTISAAIGLVQYFVLQHRDLEHRITGPVTHVMTFSGLLLPISLLVIILGFHMRKWWMAIPASIVTLTLLLTFTRSIWLGWICAMFAVLVFTRPRMLAWAAPALVLFITFMPLSLFGRMVSIFDTRLESNLDRIRMAEAGVEIIRDYPLFGVGPANVKEIYPLYRRHDAPRFRIPHLHNTVLQIWAERGILGLAAYLLLLALFVRQCVRAWNGPARAFAQAGVAIAVGLAVAGLFEFNFGDTEVFYIMLDLMALIVAMTESNEPLERAVEPLSG